MKRVILIFLLCASSLFAQRKSLIEGEIDHGGFGGPRVKFSSINNNFGVLVGGYGGWLINHQLLIGGGGYGLANNIKASNGVQNILNYNEQPYIDFGYGGAVLEYYINPEEVLHSSVSVLIGAGGVSYRGANPDHHIISGDWKDSHQGDAVFVLEPGLSGELNVSEHFKVGLNLSYRYVSGVKLYGIENSDLSNFTGGISLKFGVF